METIESLKAELERVQRALTEQQIEFIDVVKERDGLRRQVEKLNEWKQCAEKYSTAWNGYKVFPSLANERLFAEAEAAFNQLKGESK